VNAPAFAERMAEYAAQGFNYFKLDNLTTSCRNPRHGHRVGKYAQVGLTDAFIAVMETARRAQPEVMINITVGSWPSPWWLLYCDVVWRSGMDFGFAGAGSKRQRNITYVDTILYRRLRQDRAQFPLHSLMTHGIIKGRRQSFDEEGENLRDFSDDVFMYFSRGVMMQELYVSPDLLSPREWEVLARGIRLAREWAAPLHEMEMVLGDPARGEVYGFVSASPGPRLLVLRNPREQTQSLPAEAQTLLLAAGGQAFCRVLYSSTSRPCEASLDPLEVRVMVSE
jgi:hypothetical protein